MYKCENDSEGVQNSQYLNEITKKQDIVCIHIMHSVYGVAEGMSQPGSRALLMRPVAERSVTPHLKSTPPVH